MELQKSGVIKALYLKAQADKAKAEMALHLLENQAVGIGDHTATDFFEDAEKALESLIDANDKIQLIKQKYDQYID